MEKKFTKFELARLKRTAQNVDQFLQKKAKLEAQKAKIDAELAEVLNLIELTDAPTKAMTGGYGTEDIIRKVVVPTDKVDKNGNLLKQTSYEFIYPDTIVPPVVEAETEETEVESEGDEGLNDSEVEA
jgi:hypothetical protein